MRIVNVSGYAFSTPIKPVQERPFHGSHRQLLKHDVGLVDVKTANGERDVTTAGTSNSAVREYFGGDSQGTFVDDPWTEFHYEE